MKDSFYQCVAHENITSTIEETLNGYASKGVKLELELYEDENLELYEGEEQQKLLKIKENFELARPENPLPMSKL